MITTNIKSNEAFTVDLQPKLDEKAAELDARLRLMETQAATEAAKFGTGTPKSKRKAKAKATA